MTWFSNSEPDHRSNILIATIVLTVTAASYLHAQESPIDRGSLLAGGSAAVTGFRDIGADDRTFIIDLNPRIGYFVARHLAVSANVVFQRFASERSTSWSWGIGPGLTYYFGRSNSRVYPFVSGRSLFRWSTTRGADWRSTDWLVGGGLVFMVATHVGLTAELAYQWGRTTVDSNGQEDSNTREEYGLRFGIAAFVF